MTLNKEWVDQYIESKRHAWAARTIQNEAYKLHGLANQLHLSPTELWEHLLVNLSPYSRVTTWARIVDFAEWAIKTGRMAGPNAYDDFRKENAKSFKNTYKRKPAKLGYEEAEARIMTMDDLEARDKALQLLRGGLRYTESQTVADGQVVGKGGKVRDVFVEAVEYKQSYATFLRRLKAVGLTPHMLRKICASELSRQGMQLSDLCEAFGWSSLETAMVYLAPMKQEQMRAKFRVIQGGNEDGEKQVS